MREARVSEYVSKHLAAWQKAGFVSEMKIETGKENEGPIRTMGWSWWHQIHNARQLLQIALTLQAFERLNLGGVGSLVAAKVADRLARNNRWDPIRREGSKLLRQPSFDNGIQLRLQGLVIYERTARAEIPVGCAYREQKHSGYFRDRHKSARRLLDH